MAIVPLRGEIQGVGVPSRLYNHMAAGKPIIGLVAAESEPSLAIKEERIGWVVPPGDAYGLIKAMQEAAGNADQLQAMGQRARTAAERSYSAGPVIEQYRALVQEVLGIERT